MNLNKSPLVIFSTVLALLVSSSAQAVIDLEFENQNPYYDDSTVNVMFYGNSINGTYNGGANNVELNRNYTFQELSGGVSITSYVGGLMYVSMGNEMTNGRGVTQPAPNNPSDPDYNTRWNNVEITVTPGPFDVADITGINLFAIPMKLEAELASVPQPDDVTYNVTGIQMRDDLGAITSNNAQAVLKDAAGNFLRVLGPTAYAAGEIGPYPSLQPYVDSIRTSGQKTTIKGTYSGNGASTPALTAQTYEFEATIESNGDIKLTGSGSVVGANQTIIVPNAQPTPHAGNIATQIYAADPGFFINGGTTIDSFGINDVYGAAVRDFLSGMAIGYVGSTVIDPNTMVAFKDESSDKWFTQALAFSQVQPTNAYYNAYAAVFFQNSNVYGFPFSDHLNGEQVQVKIGPADADTLWIKVLTDGAVAPLTFQQAQTNAIANAGSPASFLLPSASAITIPDTGGTHGLQYDTNNNLIVRAPVLSSTLSTNYVGQTGVTIAGAPTTAGERVTTGNDFTNFYTNDGGGTVNGMLIRAVERGMGLNNTGTHNAIVEYSVTPNVDTIQRLTKNPDIATYNPSQYGDSDITYPFVQPAGMSTTAYNNFVAFYNQYRTSAYTMPFDSAVSRPFTQLGYTYLWQNGGQTNTLADITGMNEFVLLGGTPVNVYSIYSTPSYIYAKNPTTNQFGNGYANFDVTGACNTIWAGHRFQQGVSYSSLTPNIIEMHMASSMSGGEGLLVWSLNYNVTNNGFIAGPTSNKFGIAGTNNIAILFMGDTSSTYGTPITQGINQLSNRGTIASPGTAIKVENGSTNIDNTVVTSVINGTTTAIDLANGNNIITNDGGKITSAGTALRLRSGSTTISNAGGTITGSIIVDPDPTGSLDIGTSTLALGGTSTYTQGAGVTLKLKANSPGTYGNISAGTATLDTTNTVNVKVGGNIGSGTQFTVVNTSGAGVGALPGTITTDSPLYSFTGDISSGNLVITSNQQQTFNSVASTSNSSAVGTALQSIGTSATGDMATVLNALSSMTSTQEISKSMETMHPNASYGNLQASNSISNQFMNKVSNRLGMVRSGAADMGISTGDFFQGTGFWFQGLGSHAKQDERGGIQGFQYNTFGTMVGADKIINDHMRVGVAGGYGYADVNSKTVGSPKDNINSFQGTIYGSFDTLSLGKSREEGKYSGEAVRTQGKNLWYVDGMFGFTQNNFESNRGVAVGNTLLTAYSTHYAQQYSPMVETGYTMVPKALKGLQITPLASGQYSYLYMDRYSEKGAGAMNLTVRGEGFNSFVQGLGMRFAYPINSRKNGTFIPTVSGMWLHDYFAEKFESSASFAGGGPSFETSGVKPAQDGFLFSSSIVFLNKGNLTVTANYDWEIKDQYQSSTYYGTVRLDF